MKPLPTLDETLGLGDVRFGMQPAQVRELLGQNVTWEEWMNGNVNDALYYPGIILFFDDHTSDGPTAASRLQQIAVRPPFRAQWRGIELARLTRDEVAKILGAGAKQRDLAKGAHELAAHRFRAYFSLTGELIELSVGAWYDA